MSLVAIVGQAHKCIGCHAMQLPEREHLARPGQPTSSHPVESSLDQGLCTAPRPLCSTGCSGVEWTEHSQEVVLPSYRHDMNFDDDEDEAIMSVILLRPFWLGSLCNPPWCKDIQALCAFRRAYPECSISHRSEKWRQWKHGDHLENNGFW